MRVRKKPVEVDAFHFDGTLEGAVEAIAWTHAMGYDGRALEYESKTFGQSTGYRIVIPTLEGEMEVGPGWWIIRGVAGEFYPCKDSVFQETYEPAEEAHDGNGT